MKNKNSALRLAPRAAGFALASVLPLAVGTASAFELNFGAVTGSLDTTLSYGAGWRLEAQDPNLVALYPDYPTAVAANRRTFLNKNDGNANFDNNATPISSVFKITSDLELKTGDYGLFVRGTAFYDTMIMDELPNRSAPNRYPNPASCNPQVTIDPTTCGFPSEIDKHAGSDARFLDAYVYGNFMVGDRQLNVRLGEQVINWGEALFLQEGINNANPVSLSKLRLPGSEVREALLPVPMLYASYELADSLTVEGFYQFDWDYSEADDVGTYYSTDDAFAGQGANRILVDLQNAGACASLCLLAQSYNMLNYGTTSSVLTNKRGSDIPVNSDGQFGLAFRYSAQNTEYGLFFMNYHSRKPVAQATTGAFDTGTWGALAPAAFIDQTEYRIAYPEDVQMIGLSFSTTAGDLSVSGEVAYRPNDIILSELGDNLVAYNTIAAACYASGVCSPATGFKYGNILNNGNNVLPGQTVKVWEEIETYNFNLVAINNFGPKLGANVVTGVLEVGAAYAPAAKDKRYASTAALLNIPLADVPAPLQAALCSAPKVEAGTCISEGPSDDYMDDLSWGYRAVLTATYNDAFAGVALSPILRFAHDVDGNSHRTGNFLENRKSATLALNALYNQELELGLAYNAFWGAKSSNFLGDRDNLTFTVKYSF